MNTHSEHDGLPEPKNVSRGDISVFARKWFKSTRQQEARHYQELADQLNVFETQEVLFNGSLLELSNYFHSTKGAVQSRAKSFGIDLNSLQHLKTNKPNNM